MEEIIQLNLTEEEATILQSLVAVGIMIHLKDVEGLERNTITMEYFLDAWPIASTSLANKMTASVKVCMELLEAKS